MAKADGHIDDSEHMANLYLEEDIHLYTTGYISILCSCKSKRE